MSVCRPGLNLICRTAYATPMSANGSELSQALSARAEMNGRLESRSNAEQARAHFVSNPTTGVILFIGLISGRRMPKREIRRPILMKL